MDDKSVIHEVQPRVQLIHSPPKLVACSCSGAFERVCQFALQHANPCQLACNPAILCNNYIRIHLSDLQVCFMK
jgi:hypothetical protein